MAAHSSSFCGACRPTLNRASEDGMTIASMSCMTFATGVTVGSCAGATLARHSKTPTKRSQRRVRMSFPFSKELSRPRTAKAPSCTSYQYKDKLEGISPGQQAATIADSDPQDQRDRLSGPRQGGLAEGSCVSFRPSISQVTLGVRWQSAAETLYDRSHTGRKGWGVPCSGRAWK